MSRSRDKGDLSSRFVKVECSSESFSFSEAKRLEPSHFRYHFNQLPKGHFTGQDAFFAAFGLHQLGTGKKICVARGEARPLTTILEDKLSPSNPIGHYDVLSHRRSSHDSALLSFTFSSQVAAFSGANAARRSYYGNTPTLGKNRFTILGIELDGTIHDVAGPGSINPGEEEATLAGSLDPKFIKAFRRCRLKYTPASVQSQAKNDNFRIVCGSLFMDKALNEDEQKVFTDLLSNKINSRV